MVDILVACIYLAFMVQPLTAVIVFVTVASYVPLTVIITERRWAGHQAGVRAGHLTGRGEGRTPDRQVGMRVEGCAQVSCVRPPCDEFSFPASATPASTTSAVLSCPAPAPPPW